MLLHPVGKKKRKKKKPYHSPCQCACARSNRGFGVELQAKYGSAFDGGGEGYRVAAWGTCYRCSRAIVSDPFICFTRYCVGQSTVPQWLLQRFFFFFSNTRNVFYTWNVIIIICKSNIVSDSFNPLLTCRPPPSVPAPSTKLCYCANVQPFGGRSVWTNEKDWSSW